MATPDSAPARNPVTTGSTASPAGSGVPESGSGMRIPRPQRWSVPFSDRMNDQRVESLLATPAFSKVDASRFPPQLPLHGVLKNDTKIRSFEEGDIIVREGDYGNSAFLILSGKVKVVLNSLPARLLGRRTSEKKTLFGSIAQLWRNCKVPEARSLAANTLELENRATAQAKIRVGRESRPHVFVQDLSHVMPAHDDRSRRGRRRAAGDPLAGPARASPLRPRLEGAHRPRLPAESPQFPPPRDTRPVLP